MPIALLMLLLAAATRAVPGQQAEALPEPVPAAAAAAHQERGEPGGAEEQQGDQRMRALLGELAASARTTDRYVGLGELPGLESELAALPAGERQRRRLDLLRQLGFHTLRLGRNEESTGHYARALEVAEELGERLGEGTADDVRFELALAWLRRGEQQNCVARHTAKSCLLPITDEGVHVDQDGARRALELLVGLFERRPRDASAAWLANVAAMTVGEWPEAVPEPWRVPPEQLAGQRESQREFPRFPELAPELGLNSFDLSGGGVVDDLDGDGVLDVLTSTWDPGGGMHLFRGLGGGRFEEVTEAGLEGLYGGLNMVTGDYDNDGDVDVLVLRGAWLMAAGRVPNSLLRNDGGRFVDVTFAAGLGAAHHPTQTAAFADYDNDGDLDLYVGNEAARRFKAPCQLFQNQGDGTFVDVAAELGVTNDGYTKAVAFGDYDGDRWPDLYVSNMAAPNRLYRNKRGQGFKDVTARLRVALPANSFGSWFFDYDNDGRLDLFVASYRPELAGVAAGYLGWPSSAVGPALYHQTPAGNFEAVQQSARVDRVVCVMGSNFGDLDGDGWLDMYLGTGYPGYEALMPNVLYLGEGGARFSDVTTAGGLGHLQKGHGVSFADLDGDGDVDLHAQMGGAFPGDAFGNALFQNPGFGNAWIEVRLRGVQSNRLGIGARIHCLITEDGAQRSIYRHVNSGGSFGANPITRTHIGLGRAQVIDRLEIWWPTSDTTQAFEAVPVGGSVLVVEGASELER